MKVKRKVAALLALAMVLTGQPAGVLAGAMPGDEGEASTKVVSDKIATPPKATPDEPENELRAKVEYTILPEDGAHILNGASTKVKSGDTLKFSFVVKDDYELSSVNVDGDSDGVKISVDESGEDKYHCEYNVGDIVFDTTQVEIALTEASEEEPFSTVLTEDGLTFTITADAGVLPEGAEARIISLEEAADIDADAVKEEVLDAEGMTEEEEPLYVAYRIELLDAEDEVLSDENINGEVEVSISGLENMSTEEDTVEPGVYKVEINKARARSLPNINVEKIGESTEMDEAQLVVAAVMNSGISAYAGNTYEATIGTTLTIQGSWALMNNKWELKSAPAGVSITGADSESAVEIEVPNNFNLVGESFEVIHTYGIYGGTETFAVTIVGQPAYFYIKRAAYIDKDTSSKEAFAYFGKGYINLDAADSEKYSDWTLDTKKLIDKILTSPDTDMIIPDPDTTLNGGSVTEYDSSGYPVFELNGSKYYCIESSSRPSEHPLLYRFDWTTISRASGANGARNETLVDADIPTWHVDATIELINTEDLVTLYAHWADPTHPDDEPDYINSNREQTNPYAKRENIVAEWDTLRNTIINNNNLNIDGYTLNWYFDADCTESYNQDALKDKAEDENIYTIHLYGKYEPIQKPVTVKFVIEDANQGNGTLDGETVFENQLPGNEIEPPTVKDTENDEWAFDGWKPAPEYTKDGTKIVVPDTDGKDIIYTAKWADDKNKDNTPDEDQKLTVVYKIAEEDQAKGNFGESVYEKRVEDMLPGDELGRPEEFVDVKGDEYAFDGWTYNGEEISNVPADAEGEIEVVAQWADDKNKDNTPDEDQKLTVVYKIAEEDQAKGNFGESVYEKRVEDMLPGDEIVTPSTFVDIADDYIFVGWVDSNGNEITTIPDGTTTDITVTAKFALDANKDGIDDTQQLSVTLQPYQTSIYFGGSNDAGETNGLPNLELEVVEMDRALISSNINTITINGHKFSEEETKKSLETFFKPLYVYSDEAGYYHRVESDTAALGHEVKTVIAVLESALPAFEGKGNFIAKDGFVYNANTDRYVTVNSTNPERADVNSFGINANDANGNPVDYFVNVNSGDLIVRQVNNDPTTVIRQVVDTENEAIAINAADDQAAAVPGEGNVEFLTNGIDEREKANPDHVKLLVDDVKDTDNRRTLLADKAFTDAYGMTAEEAEAQGYDSELKFLDLVDTQNGNAWVKSATGTFVFWPYPEGTGLDTEFKLAHFEGLDRETDYDGAEAVANAIAEAPIKDDIDLKMEPTAEGIKFFTDGDLAFSPFILMWKTDDGNGNGGGGNDHDSTTGGSGTEAAATTMTLPPEAAEP